MRGSKFFKKSLLTTAIALSVGAQVTSSIADDTDIFLGASGAGGTPNILFLVDNSANWTASMGDQTNDAGETRTPDKRILIHDALFNLFKCIAVPDQVTGSELVDGVEVDTVVSGAVTDLSCPEGSGDTVFDMNVGLMAYSDSNSPRGGEVWRAISPLTASDRTDWLNSLVANTAEGKRGSELTVDDLFDLDGKTNSDDYKIAGTNNAPYAMSFYEAYLYYTGGTPNSGLADGDHDPSAVDSDGKYISPLTEGQCGDSYIIMIGNGGPDSGENSSAQTALASIGGDTNTVDIAGNNKYESNWSDEFARYLSGIDLDNTLDGNQSITTYAIDVYNPDQQGKDPATLDERGFMDSIAAQGGTDQAIEVTNATELYEAIDKILNEILAVNTAFAATALPVSVNVRGTNLNQVYIGVFRPDTYNRPLWPGNLKMYTLGVNESTGDVRLEDKNGNPAENMVSGFINSDATSFWSVDSTYWAFDPRGTIPSASDAPDGEVVEKGGVAQRIRSGLSSGRSLLTFTSVAAGTTPVSLNGQIDATLYSWLSGNDIYDENENSLTSDMRPYVHGDVIHSQPAIVNYNTYGNDDTITVFYGSNDGLFRAVEGGPGDDSGDHRGDELWGLVMPEHLDALQEMSYDARDDSVDITDPETTASKVGAEKPYFIDGGIGVYTNDAQVEGETGYGSLGNIGDTVNLYLGMRRGGQMIYALDVNDVDNPTLLWSVSNDPRSGSLTPGFEELGQTWSKPTPITVRNQVTDGTGTRDEEKVLLLFGAGYDPAVDDLGVSRYGSDAPSYSVGRGIYALDAMTGDIVAFIGATRPATLPSTATFIEHNHMNWSIPSDLTIIDRDRDGYEDRIYVGDMGSHVWRIDLGDLIDGSVPTDQSNAEAWKVSIIASLDGGAHRERLMYPPDVVDAVDDPSSPNPLQLGYDAILIGSGDREDPFDTTQDYSFYMLKDMDVSPASPGGGTGTVYPFVDFSNSGGTYFNKSSMSDITSTSSTVADNASGWYFTLEDGEKVTSNAVTLSGVVYFNSFQPTDSATSCDSLGTARSYAVRLVDGMGVGADYTPKNERYEEVAGGGLLPSPVPGIVEIDGKLEQVVISGTHVTTPVATELSRRYRVSRGNLLTPD